MRAFLAAKSADRISHCAVVVAGSFCGVLLFFVALPLAMSSPYPAVNAKEWIIEGSPPRFVSLLPVPVTIDDEDDLELEAMTERDGQVIDPDDEATLTTASTNATKPGNADSKSGTKDSSKDLAFTESVDQYLWDVYERTPIKRDSTGDFTWKDLAAAKRLRMPLKTYVIDGMDPDFREQLYHAGRAMDAAGIRWAILSAFRDDYRQSLASGFKAHGGHSQHGGSSATGGYGHGRAVDLASADGDAEAVWQWLDAHGAKYGLHRPMPGADPAHTQPRGAWHDVAVALRAGRTRSAAATPRPSVEAAANASKALGSTSW